MKNFFLNHKLLRLEGESFSNSAEKIEGELTEKMKREITSTIESMLDGILQKTRPERRKVLYFTRRYYYNLPEYAWKFSSETEERIVRKILNIKNDDPVKDGLSIRLFSYKLPRIKDPSFPNFSSEGEEAEYFKKKIQENKVSAIESDQFSFFLNDINGENKDLRFDLCRLVLSRVLMNESDLLTNIAIKYIMHNLDDFIETIKPENKMVAFYYLKILRAIRLGIKKSDWEEIEKINNVLKSLFPENSFFIADVELTTMSDFSKEEKIDFLVNSIDFSEFGRIIQHKEKYKHDEKAQDLFSKIELLEPSNLISILNSMTPYQISFLIQLINYETGGMPKAYERSLIVKELNSPKKKKATDTYSEEYYSSSLFYMVAPGFDASFIGYNSEEQWYSPMDENVTNSSIIYRNLHTEGEQKITPFKILSDSGLDISRIPKEELYSFQYSIQPKFRYILQKRFNIELGELSIRTQFNLIHFFIENEEEWPKLNELLDLCGQDRNNRTKLMKVFTGLNIQENLDKLLSLAKSDPETFKEFTDIYSHIIDSSENLFATLNDSVNNPKLYETFPTIKNKYIDKANALFQRLSQPKSTEIPFEALTDARNINLDMISVATIFAECKKGGIPVSFDDFAKMDMNVLTGNEMTIDGAREVDTYMSEMIRIYEENITNKDKVPELIPTFKARADDVHSEFHVLKLDSAIVAFIVFTKNKDGTYFASGLNVNKEVRGSGIGEVMMRETILEKMKTATVTGSVVGTKEVAVKYLKDGAIMFNPIAKANDTNLTIVWDKENEGRYVTKSTHDTAELLKLAIIHGDKVKVVMVESQEQIPFDLANESSGFVITRILKAEETPDKKMRVIFEKRQGK